MSSPPDALVADWRLLGNVPSHALTPIGEQARAAVLGILSAGPVEATRGLVGPDEDGRLRGVRQAGSQGWQLALDLRELEVLVLGDGERVHGRLELEGCGADELANWPTSTLRNLGIDAGLTMHGLGRVGEGSDAQGSGETPLLHSGGAELDDLLSNVAATLRAWTDSRGEEVPVLCRGQRFGVSSRIRLDGGFVEVGVCVFGDAELEEPHFYARPKPAHVHAPVPKCGAGARWHEGVEPAMVLDLDALCRAERPGCQARHAWAFVEAGVEAAEAWFSAGSSRPETTEFGGDSPNADS